MVRLVVVVVVAAMLDSLAATVHTSRCVDGVVVVVGVVHAGDGLCVEAPVVCS